MIDPRVRELHISKYGQTEDVLDYLRVLDSLTSFSDDKTGQNHHKLARSIWPEYSNLKLHPWNKLRVSHGVHRALTEIQSWFEKRLRSAALRMKGQSAEAHIEACRRGGEIAGQRLKELGRGIFGMTPEQRKVAAIAGGQVAGKQAFESGQLAAITTHEICSKGGKACHDQHPEVWKELGTRVGKRNYALGKGLASMTREQKQAASSEGGKISGRKAVERGTGLFGMTPEQKFARQ